MKRFLNRFAVIAVVLLLISIAIPLVLYVRASLRFQAQLKQVRDSGAPTTLAELERPIPDEENAYLKLTEVADELTALSAAIGFSRESAELSESRANETAAFIKFEAQHPDLIERLRAASQLRHSQAPKNFSGTAALSATQLNSLADYRTASRALSYHAEAQLAAGDTDEALLDALAILRWSDLINHEPGIICFMVSAAIRGTGIDLAQRCLIGPDASASLRDELLDYLANSDPGASWSRAIDNERAIGITAFDEMPGPARMALTMQGDPSSYLDLMEEAKAVGAKPSGAKIAMTNLGPLTTLVLGSIKPSLEVHRQLQAKSRAVQILAAWQDRIDHTSVSIADLVLPATVATDPFDGSMIKMKHSDPGWIIYSVGANGVDDGGSIYDSMDIGFAIP